MEAHDLLGARAALTPEREALLDLATGHRYTYAQLDERANRAANLLRNRFGIVQGDRVAILAHNCIAHIDLFYGAAKIGAILAPLNWRLSIAELSYIVGDCQPRVLVCGPEFGEAGVKLCAAADVERCVALEGAEIDGAVSYEQGLEGSQPDAPGGPPLDPDDPLCILYTSGTTGRPKGAIIPHRQVLWNCINTVVSWGLTERDVSPIFTPLFHAGGLFAFLTPLLYLGGRVLLGRAFSGERDLQIIEEERCTVILGVPTIYQMWRETPAYDRTEFGHVRFFISGGAPCPVSLMRAWREEKGVVFRQGYGLTEVGPNCFAMTDEESVTRTGSIGRACLHGSVRLVDESGTAVSPGQVGEIAIRGPHVCSGYWRNPVATAAAIRDGWFHTGDMATADEDGFVFVAGRSKEMIISGGENIYAAEVEAVFNDHPAVAESALIGQPDEKWGEVGVVVVIPRKDNAPTPQDLLGFCDGRLARYKIPKRVVFAEDFPRTALGKPQKAELKRLYAM